MRTGNGLRGVRGVRHGFQVFRVSLYEPRDGSGTISGGYDSLDRLRVFVDGSQTGITAHTGTIDGTTEPFWIGERSAAAQTPLDGQIQEVAVLSTALTPTQIKELYEIGKGLITGPKGNGNLADDGVRLYEWDALNRLKTVADKSTGNIVGQYTYDALGRRIRKVITGGGLSGNITNGTTDYVYTGARCCEERNGSNVAVKQYVWGRYIDELLQQRVDIDTTPADQYLLSDLLYRAVALVDDTGTIIEAYDTDAYGNTLIFNAAGGNRSQVGQ